MKRFFVSEQTNWKYAHLSLALIYLILYGVVIHTMMDPVVKPSVFKWMIVSLAFLTVTCSLFLMPAWRDMLVRYKRIILTDDQLSVGKTKLTFEEIQSIEVNAVLKKKLWLNFQNDAVVIATKDGRVFELSVFMYRNHSLLRYNLQLLQEFIDGRQEAFRPANYVPEKHYSKTVDTSSGFKRFNKHGIFYSVINWGYGFSFILMALLSFHLLITEGAVGFISLGFASVLGYMLFAVNKELLLSEEWLVSQSYWFPKVQKKIALKDMIKAEVLQPSKVSALMITDTNFKIHHFKSELLSYTEIKQLADEINERIKDLKETEEALIKE